MNRIRKLHPPARSLVRALILTGCARHLAAAPSGVPAAGALDSPGPAIQVVLLLAGLAFLPALFMSVTPFLRIIVVLHFLRQAIGTQTAPSNQLLTGFGLLLTLAIMQPVVNQVHQSSFAPYERGEISMSTALERAALPVRSYLSRFTREKDVALMLEVSGLPAPRKPEELDLRVLMPAYVLSELRTSFQIGVVLFLPFLVVDLVVASVTLTLGMVQLPPVMLSAPLKILLFVLVDGWNLVIGSLVRSFR